MVVRACEATNVSRISVWRHRQADPAFATRYDEALKSGALILEAEAVRRASEGLVRKKFTKGGAPIIDPATGEQYVEREYSDTLLLALLRRHYPEYREAKADINVSTQVHNHIHSPERLKALRERHAVALQDHGR